MNSFGFVGAYITALCKNVGTLTANAVYRFRDMTKRSISPK